MGFGLGGDSADKCPARIVVSFLRRRICKRATYHAILTHENGIAFGNECVVHLPELLADVWFVVFLLPAPRKVAGGIFILLFSPEPLAHDTAPSTVFVEKAERGRRVVMYLYDLMQVVNGLGWMPYGFAMLIMIVFSLINFILYFLGTRDLQRINPREVHRRRDFQKKMGEREQSGRPLHKCTVCGRTDKDFPDLEFRYCSKCDGAYEYCSEHLYTHKHIVAHSYDKQ